MRLFVIALLATVAGCGPAEPGAECLAVPEAVRAKIESALVMEGTGSIARAAAARSPDHEEWYYIAAEIDGPGLEGPGHVGVWASSRLVESGSGLMFSVDETAKGFSEWGDGGKTKARLRYNDAGARAAERCL